jgi:hypothetical protein
VLEKEGEDCGRGAREAATPRLAVPTPAVAGYTAASSARAAPAAVGRSAVAVKTSGAPATTEPKRLLSRDTMTAEEKYCTLQ